MLGQRGAIAYSRSQASLRHEVRQLRAKVRTLIPDKLCTNFERRNERVEKIIIQKKQFEETSQAQQKKSSTSLEKKRWKSGAFKVQQWDSMKKSTAKNIQFQKLNSNQLEMINDDKVYYLGEDNVTIYNQYLNSITKPNNYNSQSNYKTQNLYESLMPNIRSDNAISLWNQEPHIIKNKSTTLMSRERANRRSGSNSNLLMSYNSNSLHNIVGAFENRKSSINLERWNTDGAIKSQKKERKNANDNQRRQSFKNMKSFQERKIEIIKNDEQKRYYQKLKIDIQFSKADSNLKQINYRRYSKIKQFQSQEKEKHEKAIQKKSILLKKGDIAQLNEELRSLMIKRKKKYETNRNSSFVNQKEKEQED